MKKICTTKNHIKAEHKKDTFQKYKEQNQKNLYSHEPSAYPQLINYPKNRRCVFQRCQTEETFSSQDQKLVETTNF